jgi:TonB family protein
MIWSSISEKLGIDVGGGTISEAIHISLMKVFHAGLALFLIYPLIATSLGSESNTHWTSGLGTSPPKSSHVPQFGGAGVDSKGVRHTWGANSTKLALYPGVITKRVWPDLPVEARRWRLEGAGLFRVQIDLGTGKVVKATVLRSTGHVVLDNSVLSALRGWQFKPGTWKEMDIPFSFSRS